MGQKTFSVLYGGNFPQCDTNQIYSQQKEYFHHVATTFLFKDEGTIYRMRLTTRIYFNFLAWDHNVKISAPSDSIFPMLQKAGRRLRPAENIFDIWQS